MDEAYFIDIGPGVGDFEGQDGGTRADYPAITSREMAEAFPETQVIAMDLPASIERLAQAREGNKKIGQAVLDRNNLQILAGDGMK